MRRPEVCAICEHARVRVISKCGLDLQAKRLKVDADAGAELMHWYHVARNAGWTNLADVRSGFASADQVGRLLIFNIRHNVIASSYGRHSRGRGYT
jgi:mRNA-degrading endonuclease HigB of HigAB toxin-antitoxin module